MPIVENTVLVSAPRETVTAIARDFERYPEYMDDVLSLTIQEQSEDKVRTVTDWVGLIRQFKIKVKWVQEDIWDEANRVDSFKQLKGDYDYMNGEWRFTEESGGTRITSRVDYEYTVPLLGPLVQKVILHLVRSNIQRSLEAIKAEAEKS